MTKIGRKNKLRNFDWWIIYGLLGKDFMWIRLRWITWGLSITSHPPRFSERMGITKVLHVGKYRIEILRGKT